MTLSIINIFPHCCNFLYPSLDCDSRTLSIVLSVMFLVLGLTVGRQLINVFNAMDE